MRNVLELLLLYALLAPLAALPLRAARRAGAALGLLCYYVMPKRRGYAFRNLSAAAGRGAIELVESPDALVKGLFRHMGRSIAEIAKVYFGLGRGLVESVRIEGIEHYERALARGRGVILVTGHLGNWELCAVTIPKAVGPIHGVARRQENPYVNAMIERTRERFGSIVVYQEGVLRKFLEVLRQGGPVGVVMDQGVRRALGVKVDFMGEERWMTKLCSSMARRTGAAVVPFFMESSREGHSIRFFPEIRIEGDDEADTRAMLSVMEDFIRRNPETWLEWLRRPRKKKARRFGAAAASTSAVDSASARSSDESQA